MDILYLKSAPHCNFFHLTASDFSLFGKKQPFEKFIFPEVADSRHANTSKPEFTLANEDLRVEHNAEMRYRCK